MMHLGGRLERLEDFRPSDGTTPGSGCGQRHVGVMGMLMMALRLRMEEVLPLAG